MVPFSHIDTVSCYWAGWLASDGNVYRNQVSLKLCAQDVDQVNKFAAYVGLDHTSSGKGWCKACFSSAVVVAFLAENFNIVPKKTFVLQPPKQVPIKLCRHFIRGFFEGMGASPIAANTTRRRSTLCRPRPQCWTGCSKQRRKKLASCRLLVFTNTQEHLYGDVMVPTPSLSLIGCIAMCPTTSRWIENANCSRSEEPLMKRRFYDAKTKPKIGCDAIARL